MYFPILIIVLSNIFYHICSKETPKSIHPMASLAVTYIVGAVFSVILYFIMNKGGNIIAECSHINWASVVLGIAIVGLEGGFIYAYKAGWEVSTAQLVSSALLALALIAAGTLLYHETITLKKVIGIAVCLVGLGIINT